VSADPFQVVVTLRYPGERADPFGQEEASVIDASVVVEDVTKLPTSSSEQASPRQPLTVSDTTAAVFLRSTHVLHQFLTEREQTYNLRRMAAKLYSQKLNHLMNRISLLGLCINIVKFF